MKKILLLLLSTFLVASCNKKEAANTPPAEDAKPPAVMAGGHPSGGAITAISPPGVTGGQAGGLSFTIQPTGHSDPASDGNSTMFWCKSSNPMDTMIYTVNGVTQKIPLMQSSLFNPKTFPPPTDTTKPSTYQVSFTRNGVPFTGVFTGPSNTGPNNGYQTAIYYTAAANPNTYLWCIIADSSVLAAN